MNGVGLFTLALAVGAAPEGVQRSPEWRADITARLGAEVDTNALRAVPGASPSLPTEVVADGLGRATLQLEGQARLHPQLTLSGSYVIGAKQFASQSTEDLVAQSAWLNGVWRMSKQWSLAARGQGRTSRIRSGRRDYDLGSAGLDLRFRDRQLSFGLRPGLSAFRFGPESRFNFESLDIASTGQWRINSRTSAALTGSWQRRSYAGNGWVIGQPTDSTQPAILTFCDDPAVLLEAGIICVGRRRVDEELRLMGELSYLGDFLLRGRYVFRRQRSNSELENVDRHRITGLATFALPARIDLSLQVGLQFNDSITFTDRQFLVEADENQNVVQIELRRPLGDTLAVEVRYGLFANQFLDAAAEFLRQTVYIGLSARASARSP